MLDREDLVALRSIIKEEITESQQKMEALMDTRFEQSEQKMEALMDTRFEQSGQKMEALMDTKLVQSENLLLEEMERTRKILEERLDLMQSNLDELNRYYRITKLENDNTALFLKLIDDLSKRVEELEKRTA